MYINVIDILFIYNKLYYGTIIAYLRVNKEYVLALIIKGDSHEKKKWF